MNRHMNQSDRPLTSAARLSHLLARIGKTGSRFLCGLLAAASLSLSANAVRIVPVQVDGDHLPGTAYLEEGVTYVPLRYLLDAFDGWTITWDSEAQEAIAVSGSARVAADPEEDRIVVNDAVLSGRVTVENGRTYVPLRLVTEALGGKAEWDPYLAGAAVTSTNAVYDASDLYWLSRIICAESGAEPMEGQIAVGNVVLNRVVSNEFPDSIPAVIFDRVDGVQFEPVENGTVYRWKMARCTVPPPHNPPKPLCGCWTGKTPSGMPCTSMPPRSLRAAGSTRTGPISKPSAATGSTSDAVRCG